MASHFVKYAFQNLAILKETIVRLPAQAEISSDASL